VQNAKRIKLPLVVTIKTTNSNYDHAICLWRERIIDFEEATTIPLTENNIDYSCGQDSSFIRVVRGYGLFPSKEIKRECKKIGILEWGHPEYQNGLYSEFFKKPKGYR